MFIRLFTFVFYLIAGLGLGYLIWGVQVGNLTESLNRMVIEDDAIRAHLARGGNDEGSKAEDAVMSALGTISEDLRKQNERIDQQGQRIERQSQLIEQQGQRIERQGQLIEEQSRAVQQYAQSASTSRQDELKSALDQCSSSQDRLQKQAEQCLFEKAELQRALESARQAAVVQPRSGTSPIQETIEPAVPNDNGPAR